MRSEVLTQAWKRSIFSEVFDWCGYFSLHVYKHAAVIVAYNVDLAWSNDFLAWRGAGSLFWMCLLKSAFHESRTRAWAGRGNVTQNVSRRLGSDPESHQRALMCLLFRAIDKAILTTIPKTR